MRQLNHDCPICLSNTIQPFLTPSDKPLLICAECRHVFWATMPTGDELKAFYERYYPSEDDQLGVQLAHADYYAQHVKELIMYADAPASQLSMIDIGCSFPILLEKAQHEGLSDVTGVDWSIAARQYGEKRSIRMITPDEFGGTRSCECDIMRFSHVLEHLADPLLTLKSYTKNLRSNGLLYITQPNFPVFRVDAACSEGLKDSNWPIHLHFFNPISLMKIVVQAGFKIIRIYTVGNEIIAEQKHRCDIDASYAASEMMPYADLGEPARGLLANYPIYAGENSTVFAIKL